MLDNVQPQIIDRKLIEEKKKVNVLKLRIQKRIRSDKRVSNSDVYIVLKGGQVTVFGKVDTQWRMEAAIEIISTTKGVSKVINQIEIPLNFKRNDANIKTLLERRMHSLLSLEKDFIKLNVRDGLVTLEGTVTSALKKASAASFVWELSGIKDCLNLIKIVPTVAQQKLNSHKTFRQPMFLQRPEQVRV